MESTKAPFAENGMIWSKKRLLRYSSRIATWTTLLPSDAMWRKVKNPFHRPDDRNTTHCLHQKSNQSIVRMLSHILVLKLLASQVLTQLPQFLCLSGTDGMRLYFVQVERLNVR